MKKLLFFVVFLAAIGAGGWGYYQHRLDVAKEQEAKFSPNPAEIYAGILEALQPTLQLHEYGLTMLVPGNRMGEFEWNFRGTLSKESARPPFFGRVTYTCGTSDANYCWHLAELAVDGRQIEIITGAVGNEVVTETSIKQDNTADSAQAGEGVKQEANSEPALEKIAGKIPSDVPDDAASEEVTAVTSDTGALPVENVKIWHTTSNTVNARLGPGIDYGVAFQMPSSTPLKLIEEQDSWGRFSYLGEDGKVYSVWMAMSLVENN